MNSLRCAFVFPLLGIWSSLPAQDPVPASAPPAGQDPAPAQQPKAKPKGLETQIGDFKVKLGGYVKVDLIHDFNEIGSTDSFDPRTIDPDDDVGVNTRMHAKATRLNLDVRGPTSEGELRLFVEGDFFSDGNGFRMRHAFGTFGPVLGGQTWSTFMDEDCMPETLDFESPIAFPLIRQAQVRYRGEIGTAGSYWAVALEDPASNLIAPGAGTVEEATPDLTGRLRWALDRGHVQLGLFAGTARFDATGGPSDQIALFGANLSANLQVFERDHVFVQATYGPGIGRYRGGVTAAPDANGDLDAIEVAAAMLGYEHHWSDAWRSTIVYSAGTGDLPAGAPAATIEKLEYAAVNLIWQFSERAWTGVEYLFGSREDNDGDRGEANRLQFSIRYDF